MAFPPSLAILDEVGQARGPHDAFIEAIETAQGAHDDPLLMRSLLKPPRMAISFLSGLMTRLTLKISELFRISIPRPRIAKFWIRKRGKQQTPHWGSSALCKTLKILLSKQTACRKRRTLFAGCSLTSGLRHSLHSYHARNGRLMMFLLK